MTIFPDMQRPQHTAPARRIAQSAMAGLLALSVLFAALLAASPQLHQYFHHDADQTDHICAATFFSHGNVTAADVPAVLAVFVALLIFCLRPLISADFSSGDLRLGFSRGPPAFLGLR